jgi:hypothetical protein
VSSGTDVTLFWNQRTGAVTVSVRNPYTGADTQIEVEPDKALYAFYHPYAYAAAQAPPPERVPLGSRVWRGSGPCRYPGPVPT